jgi:hypothetical protein
VRVWRRGISAAVVVLAAIAGATFPSVPATAVPTVIDVRVAASSDDAEESSGGSVSLTSSDLELVTDGTVVQTVGVRFRSLAIPKGATITAAWIQRHRPTGAARRVLALTASRVLSLRR